MDNHLPIESMQLTLRKTTYSAGFPFQLVQLHSNEATAEQVTKAISKEIGIDYAKANGR